MLKIFNFLFRCDTLSQWLSLHHRLIIEMKDIACALRSDVDQVDVTDTNVSTFEAYRRPCAAQPLLIKRCVRHWPLCDWQLLDYAEQLREEVVETWNFEYQPPRPFIMNVADQRRPIRVEVKECSGKVRVFQVFVSSFGKVRVLAAI